jgi:hypothetical protein
VVALGGRQLLSLAGFVSGPINTTIRGQQTAATWT